MLDLNIKIDEDGLQVNKPYNAVLTFTDKKVKACTCNKEAPRFKIFDEVSEEDQLPFRFSMKKIDDDSVIVEYINKKFYEELETKVNELTTTNQKLAELLPLVNYYRSLVLHTLEVDLELKNGRNI